MHEDCVLEDTAEIIDFGPRDEDDSFGEGDVIASDDGSSLPESVEGSIADSYVSDT